MRKVRFFIMAFVLAGIMFIFSGCGYGSSILYFNFEGKYMADKYIDLLILLDENDELYTSYNCNIEGDIEIPENSEIVNYNKDGYRSILMHIKESHLSISIRDSENYHDSDEKYNGTPYEISQDIDVPYYSLLSCSQAEAYEFCDKYRKCRVAIFDKDGNILQISKEIPLVSLGDFYLQDISYDVEKNRVKPFYPMPYKISIFIAKMWLLSVVGMIGCIITLKKANRNKSIASYKGYIIKSLIFNIPTALFIIAFIYYALGTSLTIADFFINLLTILKDISILLIFILVNIGILIHFIRLEKKLRMKKYLEEKYREEHLDISEKI